MNINVCNCENTTFTGNYCNERFKLERVKLLDITIQTINILLIITIIIIIFLTLKNKNNPMIKGGNLLYIYIYINTDNKYFILII